MSSYQYGPPLPAHKQATRNKAPSNGAQPNREETYSDPRKLIPATLTLNVILAAGSTHIRYNVTTHPSRGILASTFDAFRLLPANAIPTLYMRLISKSFPWSFEMPLSLDITCGHVWEAIHSALQVPLGDSEWGMLFVTGTEGEKRKEATLKAYKKRLALSQAADRRILRCDYLGEDQWFLGLEKHEEYQKRRTFPNLQQSLLFNANTWLVKMGK